MSEPLHNPNTSNDLLRFTKLEAVPDEEVEAHKRGVRLVSETILPHMANAELVLDQDGDYDDETTLYATSVLYSAEKDISAEVIVRVWMAGEEEDIADSLGVGEEVMSVKHGLYALEDVELFSVTAQFFKGSRHPTNGYDYGTVLYFKHDDDPAKDSAARQIGHLELVLSPDDGKLDLAAHFGDAGDVQDGDVNFGAVETMATWLRDVKELKPGYDNR